MGKKQSAVAKLEARIRTRRLDDALAVARDRSGQHAVWAEFVVIFGGEAGNPTAIVYNKRWFKEHKLPIPARCVRVVECRSRTFRELILERKRFHAYLSSLLRRGRKRSLVDYADCGVLFYHQSLLPLDVPKGPGGPLSPPELRASAS